jgi:hypothetical protein
MLRTTFHNTVTTPLSDDVHPDTLINLLHDHSFLITMSPIVTRHNEIDRELTSGKVKYDVWEHIALLPFGLWKYEIKFNCAFQDKSDGIVSWIEAPMGFTSKADYTVRSRKGEELEEGEGMVLQEAIESSCSMVFKLFVEWTMVPVRRKMHAQILAKAKELDRGVQS